jgi:dipeptidase D
MNRVLWAVKDVVHLSELTGGNLRNAIPRESVGLVMVASEHEIAFKKSLAQCRDEILKEYKSLESDLSIEFVSCEPPNELMPKAAMERLLCGIRATLSGVYRMSPDINGLVETSNNLARVRVKEGYTEWACLTRSSVESSKWDLVHQLEAVGQRSGCTVEYSGDYPGWAPNMNSPILELMRQIYIESYNEQPHVAACHAGLECGIIGKHYPGLDMISFGPNILGAHSPDERASISSSQKFWEFLCQTLAKIPAK